MKNEEQIKNELIKVIKEAKILCESISGEKCGNGECPLSDKGGGCICEKMVMSSPFEWEVKDAAD